MPHAFVFITMLSLNLLAAWCFGFESESLTYMSQEKLNWWFSFSTHFSHHSLSHLSANMLALGILVWLFPISFQRYLWALLITVMTVRAYVELSNIHSYLGFSALLFVLPGHHLMRLIMCKNIIEAVMVTVIMMLHLELFWATDAVQQQTWVTMHMAHLIGFISGAVVFFIPQKTTAGKINSSQHSLNQPRLGTR